MGSDAADFWILGYVTAMIIVRDVVVRLLRRARRERAASTIDMYAPPLLLAVLGIQIAGAWGLWYGVAMWAAAPAYLFEKAYRRRRKMRREAAKRDVTV